MLPKRANQLKRGAEQTDEEKICHIKECFGSASRQLREAINDYAITPIEDSAPIDAYNKARIWGDSLLDAYSSIITAVVKKVTDEPDVH